MPVLSDMSVEAKTILDEMRRGVILQGGFIFETTSGNKQWLGESSVSVRAVDELLEKNYIRVARDYDYWRVYKVAA